MLNRNHLVTGLPKTPSTLFVMLPLLAGLGCILSLGCGKPTAKKDGDTKEKKVVESLFNTDDFSQDNIQVLGAPYSTELDGAFQNESFEFTLEPQKGAEYMFEMEKGDTLFYTWSSETENLSVDFHGHPGNAIKADYPENFWFRYSSFGQKEHHGKLVAPIAGPHGWYFKNQSDSTATIKFQTSGDYSKSFLIE